MKAMSSIGLAPGTRALIVNADDLGSRHSVNVGIYRALQEGIATSTSLMVPCAWAYDAMAWLGEHPEIPFAVHLTLVRDFDVYRWGPVAGPDRVPSLVDGNGHFRHFSEFEATRTLASDVRIDEVEREFRAQIAAVLRFGLLPTHLDWHCLPDGGREDVFDLTVRLALEHGLALRVHTESHQRTCQATGRSTIQYPLLDSYAMPIATKLERFRSMLRALPSGLTEWAIHPGIDSPESRAVEPTSWRTRALDLEFVCSDEARAIVDNEGIALFSYRDLQPDWRG